MIYKKIQVYITLDRISLVSLKLSILQFDDCDSNGISTLNWAVTNEVKV